MEAETASTPLPAPVPGPTRIARLTRGDVLAAAAVWIVGAAIFFRFSLFGDKFDISGNDGDARLLVYLHEHWFRVFHGDASWLSPSFFYPATRTLGYSDTLLVNQVFYTPFRMLGFDQFASFQLTLVALNLVGFVGWFVVARSLFRLGRAPSLVLAVVAAFANSQHLTVEHAQLWSTSWIPWLVIAIAVALSAPSPRGRFVWGVVAGGSFGLLAYSSFYVAWLSLLAVIVIAAVGLVTVIASGRAGRLRIVVSATRQRLGVAAGAAVGSALLAIPFLMTYLPVVQTNGSRSYADAMFYSTRPRDIVNVSATNYLWGATARSLVLPQRLANIEYAMVATPLLVATALAAALVAAISLFSRRPWTERIDRRWALLSMSAAVAMVAMSVMPMQFSWGSLWVVPWNVVPGANAIRAIGRAALFATPLALVAIGALVASIRREHERPTVAGGWLRVAAIVLAALVVVEQVNTQQTTAISRADQNAMLDAVPAPPPACRSFYLLDSSSAFVWHAEVGAMLISHEVGLPTLNGYSGNAPPGFGFTDAYGPGYQDMVLHWAGSHGITDGLCSYDPTRHEWTVTFE